MSNLLKVKIMDTKVMFNDVLQCVTLKLVPRTVDSVYYWVSQRYLFSWDKKTLFQDFEIYRVFHFAISNF